ncbi:hypothetical protein AB0M47_40380 [Hamadaea sp. NPDC051192]|uniref:hypothetical protein n=1 Tax=Hamadaea sp. NPDC051192 TaxID=3154940 RepID=UPI00343EF859
MEFARRCAADARQGLLAALERSADVHDRAVRTFGNAGDDQRAETHRLAALADRARAAQIRDGA